MFLVESPHICSVAVLYITPAFDFESLLPRPIFKKAACVTALQ